MSHRSTPESANTQLRILACFHGSRNITSIMNLLEASRGVLKPEGLCVYALRLMELSERSSAILMVNKVRKNGLPFWNKGLRNGADQVVVAFEAFQRLSRVSVRPMTAISSMSDMHEDICSTPRNKGAAIIILPFHKHQRWDGSLETTRSDLHQVNCRVLENAPCSVGILVDRGLGGTIHVPASNVSYNVNVLFFGGPDDREAHVYGSRMAEHPGISLSVIRFLVESDQTATDEIIQVKAADERSTSASGSTDDEFLSECKLKLSGDKSFKYEDKTVKSTAETIGAIREVSHCNLFLVGLSSVLSTTSSEWPELGPVGSLLASPVSSTTASILVILEYNNSQLSSDATAPSGEESPSKESVLGISSTFQGSKSYMVPIY